MSLTIYLSVKMHDSIPCACDESDDPFGQGLSSRVRSVSLHVAVQVL